MKLPEVLKMAVESGDWELVCQAYTGVTGLPLSPPKPKEDDWASMEIPIHSGKIQVCYDGLHPDLQKAAILDQRLHDQNQTQYMDVAETTPDFDDKTEPIIDENIARGLVQDEGNNLGEYANETEGESPFANDESVSSFISPSKSGRPQQELPDAEGKNYMNRQKMLIPEKRTNRFEDNLDAFVSERVDLNPRMGVPSVSERRVGTEVEVTCASCNKIETISSSLATGYSLDTASNTYKCNGCITGRRKLRE